MRHFFPDSSSQYGTTTYRLIIPLPIGLRSNERKRPLSRAQVNVCNQKELKIIKIKLIRYRGGSWCSSCWWFSSADTTHFRTIHQPQWPWFVVCTPWFLLQSCWTHLPYAFAKVTRIGNCTSCWEVEELSPVEGIIALCRESSRKRCTTTAGIASSPTRPHSARQQAAAAKQDVCCEKNLRSARWGTSTIPRKGGCLRRAF